VKLTPSLCGDRNSSLASRPRPVTTRCTESQGVSPSSSTPHPHHHASCFLVISLMRAAVTSVGGSGGSLDALTSRVDELGSDGSTAGPARL